MSDFLADTHGVVDANSYERLMLWSENQRRDRPLTWQENNLGLMEYVGWLDSRPICISLTTAIVDGKKILFVDPTSQLVDHALIDSWLEQNLPKTAFRTFAKYLNRVNAMNFINVFHQYTHSPD